MKSNSEALQSIRANIAKYGHHIYVVAGGPNPRFSYSIGLSQEIGFEVIMAGGSFYSTNEVGDIIDKVVVGLRKNPNWQLAKFEFGKMGMFSLCKAVDSWSSRLILGALDYYKASKVEALQILPAPEHRTIDVPNLTKDYNLTEEPVWQWLEKPWKYPISKQSIVATNLDALRGKPITEAMRWEENEWELFAGAGPDIDKSDIRIVPLATLLGYDITLECVTSLELDQGLWRDSEKFQWHPWGGPE